MTWLKRRKHDVRAAGERLAEAEKLVIDTAIRMSRLEAEVALYTRLTKEKRR